MPPLPPRALDQLLETLPPERREPFPYLNNLSTDELIERQVAISGQLKLLEQDRHAIHAELAEVFSNPDLRFGIHPAGGWVLR